MADRKPKILLVEPNPELLEMLVEVFTRRFDVHLTCVDSAGSCLDVELGDPHDLVIAEFQLDDVDAIELADQLCTLTGVDRPIVLLADKLSGRLAVRAMRAGVRDVFPKPFPVARLLDRVHELLREYQVRRKHAARYHRMRGLVRRVLRERHELNRRTEFICRDLVGAHRRLVHRVLAVEDVQKVCS